MRIAERASSGDRFAARCMARVRCRMRCGFILQLHELIMSTCDHTGAKRTRPGSRRFETRVTRPQTVQAVHTWRL
jgi:hypothetical protein